MTREFLPHEIRRHSPGAPGPASGTPPIGEGVEGRDAVDAIYAESGEGAHSRKGSVPAWILAEGDPARGDFPGPGILRSATIIDRPRGAGAARP